MIYLQHARVLLGWSGTSLLMPPISVLLLLVGGGLWYALKRLSPIVWRTSYWWAFSHLLLSLVVIAVAAAAPEMQAGRGDRVGYRVLSALLWVSVVSCAFWIWRMKGIRWFAVGLMLFLEIAFLSTFFVGIIVTADWSRVEVVR